MISASAITGNQNAAVRTSNESSFPDVAREGSISAGAIGSSAGGANQADHSGVHSNLLALNSSSAVRSSSLRVPSVLRVLCVGKVLQIIHVVVPSNAVSMIYNVVG